MKKEGFTLIEILVVVTLSIVLSTVGFISYNEFRNRKDLELSLQETASTVREAQNRSTTQQDGSRWSVRFTASTTGSDKYEVYSGATYSSSAVEAVYTFDRPVKFSEPSENRTVDLQFEPITGKISNKKIITLTHENTDSRAGDITVNTLGQVTDKMLDDIEGYWHMDEGTGTSTADASGNGNNGDFGGDPTWSSASDCVVGQCVSFDGSGDEIEISDSDFLDVSEELTIAAWIKPNDLSTNTKYILRKRVNAYGMIINTSEQPGIELRINGAWETITSPSSLNTNEWSFVVGTYDGQVERLYVDGSEVASSSVAGTVNTDDAALVIGDGGSSSQFFDGEIDEVQVYSTALSSTTIKEMYDDLK